MLPGKPARTRATKGKMAEQRKDGMLVMIDGATSIVIDERTKPVIVTSWFGEATERIIDEYFDWSSSRLARARAARERLVLLNDTFAIERPTPMVRKRLAERTKAQSVEDQRAVVLGSVVVIESALVRGAVTALGWILPSLSESQFVASIDEAIDRSLAILAKEGLPPPAGFSRATYRRPARP